MSEIDAGKCDAEPIQVVIAGLRSLFDHLQELRGRLIKAIIAVAVGSSISYFYAADIVHLITAPAGKLYYMNPAEAFFAYLQISVFTGFLLALPVVLYQAWAFIVSALSNKDCKALSILVPASVVLFFIGLVFSY